MQSDSTVTIRLSQSQYERLVRAARLSGKSKSRQLDEFAQYMERFDVSDEEVSQ